MLSTACSALSDHRSFGLSSVAALFKSFGIVEGDK